jgi:hypothetical protein
MNKQKKQNPVAQHTKRSGAGAHRTRKDYSRKVKHRKPLEDGE